MTRQDKATIKRLLKKFKYVQYTTYTIRGAGRLRIIGRTGKLVFAETYYEPSTQRKGIGDLSPGCTQRKTLEGTLQAVAKYDRVAAIVATFIRGIEL